VLKYIPLNTHSQQSAFSAIRQRRRRTTRDRRPDSAADGHLWHRRVGHIGQWALHQLGKNVLGARLRGPCTTECADCTLAKITKQISRRAPERPVISKCQIVTVICHLATWPPATTTYVYCLRLLYESLFTAYEYCMSHSFATH
jgi:hypothetical protein